MENIMTKKETVLYRSRPTNPEPSEPESIKPSNEELNIMDFNYEMQQGNVPQNPSDYDIEC